MDWKHRKDTGSMEMPPPPAPPSRDANPWPMPEQHPETQQRARSRGLRLGKSPFRVRPEQQAQSEQRERKRLVPVFIVFAILGLTLKGVIEAAEGGDLMAVIGPLIIIGLILFITLYKALRRKG